MACTPNSVYDLIKLHVKKKPDAIAVSKGETHFTYAQLDAASWRIASLLASRGVVAGDIVPILTSRCLEMVACVLAVIRLGAVWVPMELGTWSRARIETVLSTLDYKIMLVTADDLDEYEITNCISLNDVQNAIHVEKTDLLPTLHQGPVDSAQVAYIIFTSGTTGVPKGVMIAHRSLLNYIWAEHTNAPFSLGATPSDMVLLLFSVAFDAFYGVLFSALCSGASVLLSESSTFIDDAKQCTLLPATPTLLGTIADTSLYKNIRAIFLGGEAPPPDLVRKWWAPQRKLWNAYGPTEATISVTMGELRPDLPVTLGHPIRNSQVTIRDANLKPILDLEAEGEICVAGTAVLALGYYKNSEQTSQKFVTVGDELIYRTGDMAKRTVDGLVFLGRRDQLIKNRGFLINIKTDVVNAIQLQEGVETATAVMHQKKLVAFVTPLNIDGQQLRRQMMERFDQFLVPDVIHSRSALPQTVNGKIDDIALSRELSDAEETKTDSLGMIHDSESTGNTSKVDILKRSIAKAVGTSAKSIKLQNSFVELGGNSMSAINVLSLLRQNGLILTMSSLFLLPSLSAVAESLQDVRYDVSNNTAAVNGSTNEHHLHTGGPASTAGDKMTSSTTDVQQGMIRSTLSEPPAGYMLIFISLGTFHPFIREHHLKDAWRSVLSQHDLFRSSFDLISGTTQIQNKFDLIWKSINVSGLKKETAKEQQMEDMLKLVRSSSHETIFQPTTAFRLITSNKDESTLIWLVHHALVDGWSVGTIVNQVRQQLLGGHLTQPSQFSHYSKALAVHQKQGHAVSKEFWTKAMDGLLDGIALNVCQPVIGTDGQSGYGDESISSPLSFDQLRTASRAQGFSLAVVLHAAWSLLLSKYSGSDNVVFASIFSGRSLPVSVPGIDDMVGPLINTCPFPVRMQMERSKIQFLRDVQGLMLQINEHQWSASHAIQDIAGGSLSKIYSTALFLEYDLPISNSQSSDAGSFPSWSFERKDWPEFGLTMQIHKVAGSLVLRALFKKGQYEAPTISRVLSHFQNIYLALLSPTTSLLAEVLDSALQPEEMLRLTRTNSTLFDPYSGPATLKEAFESGVEKWPQATAIEGLGAESSISYAQLNAMANSVAMSIMQRVQPQDVVAILGDGSCQWLIGVLGIIKAGAVYLPLDTKLPVKRMKIMMEAAHAKLCIYPTNEWHKKLPSLLEQTWTMAADGHHSLTTNSSTAPKFTTGEVEEQQYAYIMFTSGSTGTPKCIRVTHQATLSHLAFDAARMHARPGRRHAQIFSPGFDVNIAEIFGTLCYGATLVLKDPADPFAHLGRVDATMITPSFLAVLSPSKLQNLDTIYLIGEAVSQAQSDIWSVGRKLYNFYGPCECTIAALYKQLQPGVPVTLGKAIPRVGVYVLDHHGRPAPVGVIGEICISGVQVTHGYIGQGTEDMTRRTFQPDPFTPNHRMYRTGDLGVWTEAMEIRFIGRVDHQVKVRGYRVELEEIQDEILACRETNVQQAAALVIQDAVYAFVTPDTANTSKIEQILRQNLPSYAVPQRIFAMLTLPTTPNQKLDRKALITLTTVSPPVVQVQNVSSSKTERLLHSVWLEAIAGLDSSAAISPQDDFFAIGGNSLAQITVAQMMCARLGTRIPLGIFIAHTQLASLAAAIDTFCAEFNGVHGGAFLASAIHSSRPPSTDRRLEDAEASHLEKAFFDLHRQSSTPCAFNVAHTVALSGDIDVDGLKQAIQTVAKRNEILNASYIYRDKLLYRRIKPKNESFHVGYLKLTASEYDDLKKKTINMPFDLERDQLTRVTIVETCVGHVSIIWAQHHIITDQGSIRVFFQQVGDAYRRIQEGGVPLGEPEAPTYSYSTWAEWKAKDMQSEVDDNTVSFWKEHLVGVDIRPTNMAINRNTPPVKWRHAVPTTIKGPSPGSSWPIHIFVAATVLALTINKPSDITIGIPFLDRAEPGTENILGTFLDFLPLRFQSDSQREANNLSRTMDSLVPLAKQSVEGALTNVIPSFRMKDVLGVEPVVSVMLVYNRREDRVVRDLAIPGVSVSGQPLRANGAKFPLLIEFMEEDNGELRMEMEYFEEYISVARVEKVSEEICRSLETFRKQEHH